ncbi:hypothetical protein GLE_1951 [Lysobacter enzymogenes]|uniref:Uncharacterized protein n=1 Tax=Lysobacter enzymogenes TaxID=69 RepID=A0A0S2DF82_LYSEN|nr:hypothetical protein GLE_1951 [Lysobacter enzymogenes]
MAEGGPAVASGLRWAGRFARQDARLCGSSVCRGRHTGRC